MITSPKYSFVQFNAAEPDACCNGINSVCLPVVFSTDLNFQLSSDTAPGNLQVVRLNGELVSSNSGFVSEGNNVYSWKSPIDLTGLACDECFQLKIGTLLSNCFIKRCDDCFTSILEYVNDEDYAGFAYCNIDFSNRVRLPFYLSKPKMAEDRGVYRKSNGLIKLTKSLLTKEYQVQTDFMTEQMHDSLCVALAHDSVNVYSSSYSGSVSKSSEYNLPWDDDMCIAQADFKVAVTPFAIRNNNCQDCAEVIPCVVVSVADFSLPDAHPDVAYNYSINLLGTAPFEIADIVKPAWMTVALTGSVVSFSGTPADAAAAASVSATITNQCGTASFDKQVTVTDIGCIPVSIDTLALPNAYVGIDYNSTFTLDGTQPFALGAIIKPSWMNVDLSGNAVTLTGIPDATQQDIEVSIEVTNCGSDTVTLAVTMDVLEPVVEEIAGTIGFSAKTINIVVATLLPADFTFSVLGNYDASGTPTEFAADITVSSGATSGSLVDAAPGPIDCLKESVTGEGTLVNSFGNIDTIYRYTLTISVVC